MLGDFQKIVTRIEKIVRVIDQILLKIYILDEIIMNNHKLAEQLSI